MKYLRFLVIILILLIITSCSSKHSNVELNKILDDYLSITSQINNELEEIAEKDETREYFSYLGEGDFSINTSYGISDFFTMQGYSIDSDISLRDRIPYQRLMGQMSYFGSLDVIDESLYYIVLTKVFNESITAQLGIIRTIVPIETILSNLPEIKDDIYLIDSNKKLVNLKDGTELIVDQDEFSEITKKLNTLEEFSENVTLGEKTYSYKIKDGIGLIY